MNSTPPSPQAARQPASAAGLRAAQGSVVEGKTAQQWHDAWLLCATGRELEWEQLCYLTAKLSSAAQGLKDAAAHGNQAARRAYRKLNAATQYLWLCPAENCEHKIPKQSLTGSRVLPSPDAKATQMVTADPGEAHPPNVERSNPAPKI